MGLCDFDFSMAKSNSRLSINVGYSNIDACMEDHAISYGRCGMGMHCAGGGGSCGMGMHCAGGGGNCGTGMNCAGS